MLICKSADINVAVFQLVEGQLKLKDSNMSHSRKEEPFVSIMLEIPEGRNKGHFSRLVEVESVQRLHVEIDLDRRRVEEQRLKYEEAI